MASFTSCDESTYLGYRQRTLDAISGYEGSLAGFEDAFITGIFHPFTTYGNRDDARISQSVKALKQADDAAAQGDWVTACTRASEAAEQMGVGDTGTSDSTTVNNLPSFHGELATQAQLEAQAVGDYVAKTVNTGLFTAIQIATVVVLIGAGIWILSRGVK